MKHCKWYGLAALCIGAGALLLIRGGLAKGSPMEEIAAATEGERLEYLCTKGMQGTLLRVQPVRIPAENTGVYTVYWELQKSQQLPLSEYAGQQGTLYTYEIADKGLYAELLTVGGVLAGAQCYAPEEGVTLDMEGRPYVPDADIT